MVCLRGRWHHRTTYAVPYVIQLSESQLASNEISAHSHRRCLGAAGDTQLAEDAGGVGGHGAASNEEPLGYLAIGIAFHNKPKDFDLARGEPEWPPGMVIANPGHAIH